METVIRHLRRAALRGRGGGPTDGQLLGAFVACQEGAAFEALLRRHGPMVLGVCRRVLGDRHDAEDAFQATFLVLVRKAAGLRSRELVGNWLYGVAYRTALKARAMSAKRRARERQAAEMARSDDGQENRVSDELLGRLDRELCRLPDKYRVPVVLCELEGRSRKEVARALGLAEGTLSWRLAQARKMLARKLSRSGAVLSAGAVAAVLSQGVASAALSASLLKSTAKAGLQLAAGQVLVGTVPTKVVALTQGVLKAMLLTKLKVASWAVGVVLLAGAGVVGLSYQAAVAQTGPQPRSSYRAPQDPNVASAPKVGRPAVDDLESLRLEIEALRREVRAMGARLKAVEGKAQGQGGGAGSYTPAPKKAKTDYKAADPKPAYYWAKENAGASTPKMPADPLAELEDAVNRLRRDPQDKRAAEAVDRAMRRLKERPKPNQPGQQGQNPLGK
jgi:RNA polymerase sigma factor (sigma-70 family)